MAPTEIQPDGAVLTAAPSLDFAHDSGSELACQFAQEFSLLIPRRSGVIEVAAGIPVSARPRRFARRPSQLEALLWGRWTHGQRTGDRCWVYFHQPRRFPNFLVVSYAVSARQTTLATIRMALAVVDQLAERKRTDALLCDVVTARISDRALARWGWEPLAPSRWHRRHIKRFYGQYDIASSLLAPYVGGVDSLQIVATDR